jgi:predicted histone-like DNA-binding protein
MINYRLVQDKSSNPRKSGKWYAKAVIGQTVSTDEIADRIQKNCSMKKSDVVAVLSELAEVIADIVKESQRAQLDGIGCFKAGLSSRGAESEDKFEVQKHIKNLHLIYQPVTRKLSTGKREKVFLSGAKVQRYKEFSAEAEGGGEG